MAAPNFRRCPEEAPPGETVGPAARGALRRLHLPLAPNEGGGSPAIPPGGGGVP